VKSFVKPSRFVEQCESFWGCGRIVDRISRILANNSSSAVLASRNANDAPLEAVDSDRKRTVIAWNSLNLESIEPRGLTLVAIGRRTQQHHFAILRYRHAVDRDPVVFPKGRLNPKSG
jgi:hypothetical protein